MRVGERSGMQTTSGFFARANVRNTGDAFKATQSDLTMSFDRRGRMQKDFCRTEQRSIRTSSEYPVKNVHFATQHQIFPNSKAIAPPSQRASTAAKNQKRYKTLEAAQQHSKSVEGTLLEV